MLRPFSHPVACILLRVVGSCCAKFETGQLLSQQLPTFVLFRDRRSVAQQCWIPSVCTALPTSLGQRTRITHGLHRLMGCNLPMMHCSSKRCWELLHRLHTTANTDVTTSNIVGPIMLGVVVPFARIFIMIKT